MQKSFALPIFFAFTLTVGCGDPAEESGRPPTLQVTFRDAKGAEYRPSAENASVSPPEILLLSLVGPDGSLALTVNYADRKLALEDLRKGTWTLRGDGLDAEGKRTWKAEPVTFTVRPDKTTQVQLEFQPIGG